MKYNLSKMLTITLAMPHKYKNLQMQSLQVQSARQKIQKMDGKNRSGLSLMKRKRRKTWRTWRMSFKL